MLVPRTSPRLCQECTSPCNRPNPSSAHSTEIQEPDNNGSCGNLVPWVNRLMPPKGQDPQIEVPTFCMSNSDCQNPSGLEPMDNNCSCTLPIQAPSRNTACWHRGNIATCCNPHLVLSTWRHRELAHLVSCTSMPVHPNALDQGLECKNFGTANNSRSADSTECQHCCSTA